jgi:hypothetical protein
VGTCDNAVDKPLCAADGANDWMAPSTGLGPLPATPATLMPRVWAWSLAWLVPFELGWAAAIGAAAMAAAATATPASFQTMCASLFEWPEALIVPRFPPR